MTEGAALSLVTTSSRLTGGSCMPQGDNVQVPVAYVRVTGSYAAAVALSQVCEWDETGNGVRVVDQGAKRWLVPSEDNWWQACLLSGNELKGAIARLKSTGTVETRYRALPEETEGEEPEKLLQLRLLRDVLGKLMESPVLPCGPGQHRRELTPQELAARQVALPLCGLLSERMGRNCGRAPKITDGWCSDMDKLLRLDDRSPEEVEQMIMWATRHSFWRQNILSPKKLRDQFPRLVIQRSQEGDDRLVPDVEDVSCAAEVPPEQRALSEASERLCNLLAAHVAKVSGETVAPNGAWRTEMVRLLEDRTEDQVGRAIAWLGTDDFWRAKILTPAALREKYITLQAAARQRQRHQSQSAATGFRKELTEDEKFQLMTAGFYGSVTRVG